MWDKSRFWVRFFARKVKTTRYKQFVFFISFITGLISGLAAVLLKTIVHHTSNFTIDSLNAYNLHFLYIGLPLLGLILTYLYIKFFVKDDINHGISKILFSISKKNSLIKPHNNYSSMVASTFTVGFGGSVGLEAPIVLTGSSIGSNLSRWLKLNYKTTTLLVGCGAAGAIAAIFKAPVAAIVFALEVLMLDLTFWSLIPLLISSVTGATIAYLLLGEGVIFSFTPDEFVLSDNLIYYILFGILAGMISTFFTRGTNIAEAAVGKIKKPFHKAILGGIALGMMIFFLPPLYGEGYETLRILLDGNPLDISKGYFFSDLADGHTTLLIFLGLVLLFKVFASALTTGSGGIGGIFAPSLFMGGISGYLFAKTASLLNLGDLSAKNFTLVGMAALMGGIMHAPLTGIFLIAEITGGYQLFLPLIITTTIAYMTIMYFEPHSIYHKRLAKRGELITHHKDKAVLRLINIRDAIETDFATIRKDATLGELIKVISKSKRNIFPVVDEKNYLKGVVLLDHIRDIIFNSEMYDKTTVNSLMIIPPAHITLRDNMETVMKKFTETEAWNLPVTNEGKYVGFISKSKLFSIYRNWLLEISNE